MDIGLQSIVLFSTLFNKIKNKAWNAILHPHIFNSVIKT